MAPAEMRAGVGSFAFGWATAHASPPFDEQGLLAFARRHAVPVVQIADNIPVHTWPSERLDRLVAEAGRAQGGYRAWRARADCMSTSCATLTCAGGVARGCSASSPTLTRTEPSPDDLIAVMRNAVPALSAAGVTVALENHDRFSAISLRHIIDSVASPYVGICLDTANSLGAGEGLREILDTLAPLTVNMHVKDVRIARLPHMMGFTVEGRPLGEGQLPIAEAIAGVRRHGRCRSVILEAWTPPAPTIAETIERERTSAESSIERLKAILRY